MKYISNPDTVPTESIQDQKKARKAADRRDNTNCCLLAYKTTTAAIILILVMLFQLSIVIVGLSAQLMTCFRRDWISTNLSTVLFHETHKEILRCDDKVEVITGLVIPTIVIVLWAFWLYFGLRVGSIYYSCCKFCGWKELKTVMKADTPETLNILVQASKDKLTKSYVTVTYTLIPIIYIGLSTAVSYGYLRVFKVAYDNVVIQPPLGGPMLVGKVKLGIIILSFIGFIALDLLYLRVMLRYAYRCQLIIYCLKLLKDELKEYKERTVAQQNQDKETELMDKTEAANTFIKELNASSCTTAMLIIVAGFQAVNCAVNLLCEEISYKQAEVVIARLLLWGFLLVFLCHKAAGVNSATKRLQDLWRDVNKKFAVHNGNFGPIILKANMFGFSVHPRLPLLIVFVLLFTIMAGAKIKWYQLKM